MRMDRVHSLGDSWTCIESGGVKRGWEVYAGIDPAHRHGIPGSTAAQWAVDEGGILTAAMATMRPGDTVFVSLIGNDFRHAIADGVLSPDEVSTAGGSLETVLCRLVCHGQHVVSMGYTNPWPDNDMAAAVANALCEMICNIANASGAKYFGTARHLILPDHFDGNDFHPTESGHRAIAAAVIQEVNG